MSKALDTEWFDGLMESCTVLERDDNENEEKVLDVGQLKAGVLAKLLEARTDAGPAPKV